MMNVKELNQRKNDLEGFIKSFSAWESKLKEEVKDSKLIYETFKKELGKITRERLVMQKELKKIPSKISGRKSVARRIGKEKPYLIFNPELSRQS